MAHPFKEHRQSKVEHSRVGHVTKGYASGGAVHDDAKEDATQIKRMVKPSALKVEGKKAATRMDRPNRARGGRTSTVNVIIAPQDGANRPTPPSAVPAPAGVAAPPVPTAPPPRLPPPGPMPPPAAGGPPMPMRSHGGRAYARGGAVKSGPAYDEGKREGTQVQHDPGKNDLKDVGRGKPITYKRGGAVDRASGGRTRSESTEHEKARRSMRATPPVTIMEDIIGGFSPSVGRGNALRDAKRERASQEMRAAGPYKRGGAIEAPAKPAPKTPPKPAGGGRGGKARLQKAARAATTYARPA